ncbi:MAG: hypothetical protein IJR86_07445 [Bacteroidaceae bacterium]|nr:hypothetical protein [Bacteroidaceae bacterium]
MKQFNLRTVLLAVFMMLGVSVFADDIEDGVKYIDGNGQVQYANDCTVLESDEEWYTATLTNGWYFFKKSSVNNFRLKVGGGHVHIILEDDCEFDFDSFEIIKSAKYTTFIHFYSQSLGELMGKAKIDYYYLNRYAEMWEINGGDLYVCGTSFDSPSMSGSTFVMNGGNLTFSNNVAYPIGCADMYLNGGTIKTERNQAKVVAGSSLTFGYSYCNFVGDFQDFEYYGEDDINVAEGLTVWFDNRKFMGNIPSNATYSYPVKHIKTVYDSTVLGMECVDDGRHDDEGAWFTLNGIRLASAPTERGMYIHNNSKVIVK